MNRCLVIFSLLYIFFLNIIIFKDKKYIYGSIIGYTTCIQLAYALLSEKNKNITVKYYGYRIAYLGMFPNVISCYNPY